jgi:hypothetical protein
LDIVFIGQNISLLRHALSQQIWDDQFMNNTRQYRNQLTSLLTDRIICASLIVEVDKKYLDFVLFGTQLLGADPNDTIFYYQGDDGEKWVELLDIKKEPVYNFMNGKELKVKIRAKILDNFGVFKAYREKKLCKPVAR